MSLLLALSGGSVTLTRSIFETSASDVVLTIAVSADAGAAEASVAATAFTTTVLAASDLAATSAAGATFSATVLLTGVLSESSTAATLLTATCVPAPQAVAESVVADAAFTATVTPFGGSGQSGVRRWLQEYYTKWFAERDAAKKLAPVPALPTPKPSRVVLEELVDDTDRIDAVIASAEDFIARAQRTDLKASEFVATLRNFSGLPSEQLKLSHAAVTLEAHLADRERQYREDEEDALLLSLVL